MFKLLGCLCGLLILVLPSRTLAQGFTLSWSGPFGAGSAIISTTNDGGGKYQIKSMANGTQAGLPVSLLSPGGYGGNDNFIFPSATLALVDNDGFSFTDGINKYDIYLPNQNQIPQTHALPNTYYECDSATGTSCVGCPAPTCASPLTSFTITPLPAVTVATLDPAPTLFVPASSTILTDPSALVSGGKVVTGVSADGVVQVVIRIGNVDPNDQPYVILTDELGNVAPANGEDGTLSNLVAGTVNTPTVVLPAVQTVNGQNYAFVVYNSPIDYARAAGQDNATASRQISIEVTDSAGNILFTTPLQLLRPPIFFVHGLWGDPGTWDQFDAYLKANISGISTYRADFAVTDGDSVGYNTPIVLSQAFDALQSFRANGFAAAQLDFIVHSMGGLISNSMVNDPAFDTPYNYAKGYIHKLITVDTPYQGSPLAKYTGASSASCKQKLMSEGSVVGGAIADLTPGSPFLQNFTIPSGLYYKHAIASYISPSQTTTAGNAVDGLVSVVLTGASTPVVGPIIQKYQPVDVCYSIFVTANTSPPSFSFPTYFLTSSDPYNGQSDLIVSEESQLGLPVTGSTAGVTTFTPGTTAHETSGLAHSHAALTIFGHTFTALPGSLDSGFGTPAPNPQVAIGLLNASVNSSGSNTFVH